tara:strand:- start:276 stop:758 length:483 start_codon:yes stop_codon:yes gene_type:complete
MAHPIHKHMHTHITKQNVKAAIRDDKAHMDYLKRDIKDDQKFHAKDKDARQLHDEQHITNLARDVRDDERKEHISRKSSPANVKIKEEDVIQRDATEGTQGGYGSATEDKEAVKAFDKSLSRKSSPFHAEEEVKKDTDKEDKEKAAQAKAKADALEFLKS